jgi:hypothetical protein
MVERTDQRTRTDAGDYEDLLDDGETTAETTADTTTTDAGGRLGGRLPSGRSALLTVVLTAGAMVAFATLLPFGSLAGLLGVFVAGFGFGALGSRQRYVTLAVAGAAAVGLATMLDFLVLSLVGVGLPLVAVGAAAGGLAAALGHYFGRDLRDGLTREV